MIIPDNETEIDLLNNKDIATNIVELILEQKGEPLTIGIHGDWGAGKSSILQMIEVGFGGKDKAVCIRFDGWRFQGFEDAKIALIEGIITGLADKKPLLRKAAGALTNILKRVDWLKLAKHGGGAALTAFTGIPNPEQIRLAGSLLQTIVTDPSKFVDPQKIKTALEGANGILKPSEETKRIPDEIREFQEEFKQLLDEAGIDQLVVLIDDLDRCLPKTIIETLEAIRLFMFIDRTAFVVAADEGMIQYAVREHFPDLPGSAGSNDYAKNYLEKLIQVPFRLPPLGESETRVYVSLLLLGSKLAKDDPNLQKLITAGRSAVSKPWEATTLDAATVTTLVGKEADVTEALVLSDQIGPILAQGTKGNPRQIKRFLNTLLLRQRMAASRGFGGEIKQPVLAKLMLAERFSPGFFDQIAAIVVSSPDGKCPELAEFETILTKDTKGIKKVRDGATASAEEKHSQTVTDWLQAESLRSWSLVQPSLGKIDLRPYLFISKEKKNYFTEATPLGKLESIATNLFAPPLSVVGMKSELMGLSQPEAADVFELARAKVIGGDSFSREPLGIKGLTILVETHPELQPNLMDFLESIPEANLGAWIIRGWESAIKDATQARRLNELRQRWASNSGNKALSEAAKAVIAVNTRRKEG